jgi:FtsP/CotA-like multicopper oxidase with cupredoxin domain
MRTKKFTFRLGAAALTLAALPLAATHAVAAEYWLKAELGSVTMPDTTVIPVWGYARCTDGSYASCTPVTVPGPPLTVDATDSTLTVHLLNNLTVPTSLVINGLNKSMTPVWQEPDCIKIYPICDPNPAGGMTYTGARPVGNLTARVRSFDAEVAPLGGEGDYTWSNVTPGTYLYQSGTHVQAQVQMGLYGALTKNAAEAVPAVSPAEAYTGVAYDNQATLLYSEIDPAMHADIVGGTFKSAIGYAPRYFLINGQPFPNPATNISPVGTPGTTLLRLLNAGLTTHVPMIKDGHWTMVAEDGKPYPYRANQYTALLSAGKTIDVLFTPNIGGGTYAVMDRRLGLSNNGASGGGMLALLQYGATTGLPASGGGTNVAPVANDDPSYTSVPGVTLNVGASDGVLINDTDTDGPLPIKAVAASATTTHGQYSLNTNGSFSYTPTGGYMGADSFTYTATDGNALSSPATVTITMAEPSAPGSSLQDNFDRTDGDLGGSWVWPVTTSSPANIQIVGMAAQAVGTDAGGLALWNAASFGTTQFASFTLGATTELSGLVLKATGGDATAPANYVRVRPEGGNVVIATKMGGGGGSASVFATQASLPVAVASGQALSAVVDAKGLVTVFVGGSYIGGVQLPDVPAWKGGGRIGIQLQTLGATVDDFNGGSL